jgi:hypothetical protein
MANSDTKIANEHYPIASRFVNWALSKALERMEVVEYEGKLYHSYVKVWQGNIKRKATSIINEIGTGTIFLKNTPMHQVWIENTAKHVNEYGRLAVSETLFKEAVCCRCKGELFDSASAELAACEDCLDDMDSDPEALLSEWVAGKWG